MAVKLLAAGKITGLIEAVEKAGTAYQSVLHQALVQCLAHAAEHGDRSLLARLVGGKIKSKKGEVTENYPGVLSKATSPREVRLWVSHNSPLRWDTDGAIVVSKTAVEKGQAYTLDEADAQPFWAMPENEKDRARPLTYDNILTVVKGLRKRLEKALDEDRFDGDPVAVRQYLDALEAVEPPKVNKRRVVHPGEKQDAEKAAEAPAATTTTDKLGPGLNVAA